MQYLVPMEVIREHQIPWSWSYGQFLATLWMLELWTQVLCKSNKCSWQLSQLSSPSILGLFLCYWVLFRYFLLQSQGPLSWSSGWLYSSFLAAHIAWIACSRHPLPATQATGTVGLVKSLRFFSLCTAEFMLEWVWKYLWSNAFVWTLLPCVPGVRLPALWTFLW